MTQDPIRSVLAGALNAEFNITVIDQYISYLTT